MNEELMKELVDIIRQMKSGSPEVFQVLVEQRSLYCWATMGAFLAASMLALLLLVLTLRIKAKNNDAETGQVIGVVALSLILMATFGGACSYVPSAIAPLGEILGVLK